jgi:hypothetical protein
MSLLLLRVASMASLLAAGAGSGALFEHSLFDALLHRFVSAGVVDYRGFESAPEFARYLDSLAAKDPSDLPRDERLAFWLNAYNAYTIALIVAHHEHESIRNIHEPWKEPFVRVGGKTYTLDNLEHDIIRPGFSEPRIHFALVCAARSCPPLRGEAYTGPKLEAQLSDQARVFLLRSPGKNHFDRPTSTLFCSPIICEYYRADFGGTDVRIESYLAQFYPPSLEKDLLARGAVRLEPVPYDWQLNARP